MANKIGFIIEGQEISSDGTGRVTVRMLNSDRPFLLSNELPVILNSIKKSAFLQEGSNTGFDYILDSPLANGFGFPYGFDFELLDDDDRIIVESGFDTYRLDFMFEKAVGFPYAIGFELPR